MSVNFLKIKSIPQVQFSCLCNCRFRSYFHLPTIGLPSGLKNELIFNTSGTANAYEVANATRI